MKKLVPPLLVALGSFLVVAGLLAKLYAYDRLAVMPVDAQIDSVAATSPDAPATYFDISQLKEVTGGLTNRTKIRGDVAAAEEATEDLGTDAVVWASYACTGPSEENCLTDPLPLSGAAEVTAFAAHGSQVLDWDGNYRESDGELDDDPATTSYVYKLPFNVEKRDYTWYNGDLAQPAKVKYDGVTEVNGLRTYAFVQDVAATKVGTVDLPGSLVGSDEPSVTGDVYFTGHLSMDVEPESGVAMTTTSDMDKWVEVNGKRVLTMIKASFSMTDATVTDNVDTYRPLALGLKALRIWAPIAGLVLGFLLIAAGILISRRHHPLEKPTPSRHSSESASSVLA